MKLKTLLARLTLGAAALSSVVGCTTTDTIVGPDGADDHLIKGCSEVEDCYAKAREICDGPYKIINSNNDTENLHRLDLLIQCQT